ncbi:PREDICTED: LOW QUALITY PROTEIN: uncharacterized protein C8orf87 homolog [Propithecus coquereli]|uniref:LOW QUALITY PROTEIN: uncharacterized protein C8orf87 homolog n=1 Tax=Propithecus coquereli TaxID=379532 RepID=UPI00063FB070|nr:PREDICTED: LOW QUALITY PROTEIN: uncharacterized protein C8orf87 homolog [Propithecus coquereli]
MGALWEVSVPGDIEGTAQRATKQQGSGKGGAGRCLQCLVQFLRRQFANQVTESFRAQVNHCEKRQGGSLSHSQGSQHGSATSKKGSFGTSETVSLERISASWRWALPLQATVRVLKPLRWRWKLIGQETA